MSQATQDVELAGGKLGHTPHICAFFRSIDEEYEVLMPFIKEGIERGDRAFHIIDPKQEADHLKRLRDAGLDPETLKQKNQLEIRAWANAHFRAGSRFDQWDMLELIQEVFGDLGKDFPMTRFIAHMEWSLENLPGCDDIIEYESRLNQALTNIDDPVICTYDLNKFSAGVVIDILRTHPMVILGGTLQENPFYVPPEVFLRELKARKTIS